MSVCWKKSLVRVLVAGAALKIVATAVTPRYHYLP